MACFKAGSLAFYDARHKLLYSAVLELSNEGSGIDPITLIARLKDKGHLDKVGGQAYVSWLPEQVTAASRFVDYTEIVRTKYALRQTLASITELANRIFEHDGTLQDFIDQYEQAAFKLSRDFADAKGDVPVKQFVLGAIELAEQLHQSQGKPIGLSTGIPDLDRMTRGMMACQLWVIAGRPGNGKTAIAMQIAEQVAVNDGLPVGVFSLEMPGEQLALRMMCSRARMDLHRLGSGEMVEGDFPKLAGAGSRIAKAPLHINDQGGLSILQLRSKARLMHQKYGIKLLVIDYLGLLHSTSKKADNRQQEVTDICTGVKNLARELKVPILLISQLNRDADRENRRPQLRDLRESGSIEQEADLVGLLYRKPGEEQDERAPVIPVNLFVAKQRNGPVGDVQLLFHRAYTRFESVAHGIDPADVPRTKEYQSNNSRSSESGPASQITSEGECPF